MSDRIKMLSEKAFRRFNDEKKFLQPEGPDTPPMQQAYSLQRGELVLTTSLDDEAEVQRRLNELSEPSSLYESVRFTSTAVDRAGNDLKSQGYTGAYIVRLKRGVKIETR